MADYWADKIANNFDSITREERKNTTPSFFSKIGSVWTAATHNDVTNVLGDYFAKPVANAAGQIAGDTLTALDYPVHEVKRVLSFTNQMANRNEWDDIFDKSQWARAWDRSDDISFGQAAITGLQKEFHFGPKWAQDADPYDGASQAAAQEFYHDTWSGKLTTGALDVGTYALDPLNFGGAALKASKVARTTIKSPAVAGAVAKSVGGTTAATGKLARQEDIGAQKLRNLFVKTDGLTASEMAQLPEFRASSDAGAIASFFERANQDYALDEAARHQMKADVFGAILGDAKSIDNVKSLSDEMAHNIYRMGEPPTNVRALAQYDRTDFGAAMIKAWNGTGEGFDSAAILKLTEEHEKEYSRLQDLLSLAGSSSKVAATRTENLGAAIRDNKIGNTILNSNLIETMIPTGLGGRPMRFVVGNQSSRVPGSINIKDSARGFEDFSNVAAQMRHTPAARKRELADLWVKAATDHDRRNVVDMLDAQIYDDAAKKYGLSNEAAQLLVREAGGRRNAYTQAMKDRVYSTADPAKLVQFVDPEDDISHVYDKAFLTTHIEQTHAITDPRDVENILKKATNRRMLERLAEASGAGSRAATKLHDLNDDFLETAGHWLTMATRAWKDTALMRLAYPMRIQVDTQFRLLSHMGMLQYMMNAKRAAGGQIKYALENSEGEKNFGDFVKGGIFREGDKAGAISSVQTAGKDYKGYDIRPARDGEELQKIQAAIESHGGAAADRGNDISTKELRQLRASGSFGKVQPGAPDWFEHWKRAADQIRTSPTARFIVGNNDDAAIKEFLNTNPAARKEWLEFKGQSVNQDEWIARVKGHVDQYLPTAELKATIANPEKARDLFDVGGAEARRASIPAKFATREEKQAAVTEQIAATKQAKADWEATAPRSAERKAAAAAHKDAVAKLKQLRSERWEARAQLGDAKAEPLAGQVNPSGKVEPMPVHGESYSPLKKSGIGQRWASIRDGWYAWAADAPETIMGRSPLYSHSFRAEMRDAIDRLGPEGIDKIGIENLRKTADRKARQEVANILFDATNSSNASHALRFVSPFFSAWEDTFKKWAKLIGDKPYQASYFNDAWGAPNSAGLVVDSEGNTVDRQGVTRNSKGEDVKAGNKDYRGQGQYVILPGLPGMKKMGIGDFKINKQSANILFQGNPPWLPGVGPLVSIPTNKLALSVWPDEVNNPVMKYILPFGVTDDSVRRQLEPSWWKQAEDALFNTKDNAQTFALLQAQELARYERGERKDKPTHDEIAHKTRNWYLLRAALNNAAPVSIQPTPKDQFYIDKAHEYQADKTRTDWQADFYNDFPGYFELTLNTSVNNTGIQATNAAYKASQKYRKDIQENPEQGWFFAGPENLTGEWSADINTWQRSHEAGQGKNFRGSKDPSEAIRKVEESKGWIQYNSAATAISLELEKRGLDNLNQKGAEDLAAAKKQYVQYLGSGNSAWYDAYNQRDSSSVQHLVTIAKNKWASDPKFAARSDQVLFKNYLDARNAIHNELQAREVHGIDNDANRDLAATWTQYTAYLRQSDPAFEQIFNRVLESDDLSRELL